MPVHGAQQRAQSNPCNSTQGVHPQAPSTGGKSAAQTLIDALDAGDHLTVQRILRRPDLPKIAVELASQLPPSLTRLKPCGTRAAAERHITKGEELDDACRAARRLFYRDRQRQVRARKTTHDRPRQESAVDQVAIDRYLAGDDTITLDATEKHVAWQQLVSKGHTPTAAGARLGMSGATARRHAAATSTESAPDVHRPPLELSPAAGPDRCAPEKTSVLSCDRPRNDTLEETG